MSTIAAGTTSGTALVSTGNTDGTIQLQVNGTTPSVTLAANGSIGVGSTPGYGTSGQVLTSAGTGSAPTWATPGGLAAATQAEMEAATSNTVAATPSNTQFHPGVAKAWFQVVGDGSAISASRNVGSITDVGAGQLIVTYTTNFSSTAYSRTISISADEATLLTCAISNAGLSASAIRMVSYVASTGTKTDPLFYFGTCLGDQA